MSGERAVKGVKLVDKSRYDWLAENEADEAFG